MAIKITRWSPDTCACVVEFEWDDAAPPQSRVHTPVNHLQVCPLHALLAGVDLPGKVNHILEQNQRKNKIYNQYAANIVSWSFDALNVLTVVTTGLTANQLNNAQKWCDANIGLGLVLIV